MGWETRGNNDYYYRKEWKNGKCVSVYVGSGELAGLLARFDRIEQVQREMEAQKEKENRKSIREIDQNLDELEQQTKVLVESFLVERGFYKTSSREWRLKAK